MQTKQFKAKSLVLVNRVGMKQSILITFLPLNLGGKPSSGALVSLRDPTVWKLLDVVKLSQAAVGGLLELDNIQELPSLRITLENKVTPSEAKPPAIQR